MQTCFSEFQGKIKLKRPKFETRCLAHASRIEAPGPCSPWRPPRRLSTKGALQRRRGHFPSRTAAAWSLRRFSPETRRPLWASGGPRRGGRCAAGTTNAVGSWALCPFNRQTNDECFGFNTFKLCKAKYIHTQSQTHRTSFMAFCFQQITFNETLSIVNSLMVCFQKLKRLIKTMSSTKSNS